jgi:hypothetical protein
MIMMLADGAPRAEQESYQTLQDCQDRAEREWTVRKTFAWCRRDSDTWVKEAFSVA